MAIWGYGDIWGYKGNVVGSFLKYRLGYYRTSSWKAIGKSQIILSNIGRYCSPQTNHQPSEAFETVNVRWGWDRCMSVFLCILGPFCCAQLDSVIKNLAANWFYLFVCSYSNRLVEPQH